MMSKERELLKEIMCYFAKGDITIRKFENSADIAETFHSVQELLAQPAQAEQEPKAWMVRDDITGEINLEWYKSEEDEGKPLYFAPPKHEPLTDEEIYSIGNKYAFHAAVREIERIHGIGI